MTNSEAQQVPCPLCGAAIGQRCRGAILASGRRAPPPKRPCDERRIRWIEWEKAKLASQQESESSHDV